MTIETQEILTNARVLTVLCRIKNQIKDRMDFANPCISCSEFEYCKQQGSLEAYEDTLSLIDEEIGILANLKKPELEETIKD